MHNETSSGMYDTFIFLSIHLLWGEFKELCIKEGLFHGDMILLSQTGKGDIPFHIRRRDTAFLIRPN